MISHTIVRRLGLIIVSVFCFYTSTAQSSDSLALLEIKKYQVNQERKFRDPTSSPLRDQVKEFIGLNYFPPNLKFRVQATFVKNETSILFKMKTTGPSLPEYRKFGKVNFEIDGHAYVLETFQGRSVNGYDDYLFIPFTDKTNGHETYEVGRYIEIPIPSGNEVTLDFNQCFNPYCSYRKGYACEIPPATNDLPIEVLAGEKKYHSKQ
jgi:uncharacterized protein (DUF1684 family)